MAVIADPNGTVNVETLYNELQKRLPQFAIPLFIRLTSKIDLTASFKLSKTALEKDGFNVNLVKDPLYFLDKKLQKYVPMNLNLYEEIQNGKGL